MTGDIDSVNHVGLAVRNLNEAARRYEDLGFTLTPLSMHKGSLKPGEPEVPFGTGNRCAVFPNNYLEILAHVEPDKYDFGVTDFLVRHEGAHIICFGCGNAETVSNRVRANGIGTSGVIPLQRDVGTPDGVRTAKFECVHFASEATPEGLIQAAHHVTPQFIHQERYIRHANGVVALSNVYLSAPDPDAFEARYEKFVGRKAHRAGRWRVFDLPLVSRVSIAAASEIGSEFPGSTMPQPPCMVGYAFATTDLGAIETRLEQYALPYEKESTRIVVPASVMFGATVVFERA